MILPPPREPAGRRRDTLDLLTRRAVDVWVATAGPGDAGPAQPYLVPVSLAWIEDRAVIALDATSRTARNLRATGTARLGVGPTRDVVLLDVQLEAELSVTDPVAHPIAERYAAQADWEPREAGAGYHYLVLRPTRIQAWREANEIAGRTLMRDGVWTV